jgi:tetratricopeptide (TPR) repeat protein
MTIVDLGEQVTEVLVTDATHWGALHQLAWLRWQQKDYAEDEPHARRALEIDPHLPQAYTVLAEILNGLDELGESWDLAVRALAIACLDMCEQPVELADRYQAFSAAG